MADYSVEMMSPLAVYFDESDSGNALAERPATLDGKIVGLLPNTRPAAVDILKAVGTLLEQRFRLKHIVLEERVHETTARTTKFDETMREKLDALAQRVDVVVLASAD